MKEDEINPRDDKTDDAPISRDTGTDSSHSVRGREQRASMSSWSKSMQKACNCHLGKYKEAQLYKYYTTTVLSPLCCVLYGHCLYSGNAVELRICGRSFRVTVHATMAR